MKIPSNRVKGSYVLLLGTSTYARGLYDLRKKCKAEKDSSHPMFTQDNGKMIYRPLTFRENIEARVNDYETLKNPDGSERTEEERLQLFTPMDSCTAVAYKTKTTRFKIIPVCKELITIRGNFEGAFLPVDYYHTDGIELDSSNGKYNLELTLNEVLEHPGWRAAMEDDVELLKAHSKIVFDELNKEVAMGFYVDTNPRDDELNELFVHDLIAKSEVYSMYVLDYYGRIQHFNYYSYFLQVAGTQNFLANGEM